MSRSRSAGYKLRVCHQPKLPASHVTAPQDPAKTETSSARGHGGRRSLGLRRMQLGQREVVTQGLRPAVFQDLYHFFMTVSWPRLFATIAAFFLAFDLLFGCLYYLVPGCIANLNPPGFAGDFFFSVETLGTVGYGEMHPQTLYGHIVSMIEIFVGLMTLALITGLMFARFSRPRARFLFAANAVVRPIGGRLTLMFRAANARQNVIQEASAQLRMLRDEVTEEGFRIRRITDLSLVRAQHPAFILGWNIMHVIDQDSPLKAESADSLNAASTVFILNLSGTDLTTGQVLMARHEYPSSAIRWNQSFRDVLEVDADGTVWVDYRKFDELEPLAAAGLDASRQSNNPHSDTETPPHPEERR